MLARNTLLYNFRRGCKLLIIIFGAVQVRPDVFIMAILQKMKHNADDFCAIEPAIIVHVVNEITNGGEYTMCGRAIPDSVYDYEGFEAIGDGYVGNLHECTCSSCMRIIKYIKRLR